MPIHPRPNQIAELTRNLQLPLPPAQQSHLLVIAETLARAYTEIRTRHLQIVMSGTEAEITALLQARLLTLLEEDVFWGQLVLSVSSGSESISFDGSHLEKRPDIAMALSNRDRFPLLVEAKIVDHTRGKTIRLYADNGIQRFVSGDYAWGRREGMMIAYVRDDSTIIGTLTPFLADDLNRPSSLYSVQALPTAVAGTSLQVSISNHQRPFTYPQRQQPQHLLGIISVWHLWV